MGARQLEARRNLAIAPAVATRIHHSGDGEMNIKNQDQQQRARINSNSKSNGKIKSNGKGKINSLYADSTDEERISG